MDAEERYRDTERLQVQERQAVALERIAALLEGIAQNQATALLCQLSAQETPRGVQVRWPVVHAESSDE